MSTSIGVYPGGGSSDNPWAHADCCCSLKTCICSLIDRIASCMSGTDICISSPMTPEVCRLNDTDLPGPALDSSNCTMLCCTTLSRLLRSSCRARRASSCVPVTFKGDGSKGKALRLFLRVPSAFEFEVDEGKAFPEEDGSGWEPGGDRTTPPEWRVRYLLRIFAWRSVLEDSPPDTVTVAMGDFERTARGWVYGIPGADTIQLPAPPLNCVIRGSGPPFPLTL
jgi:hypothetical protein